jgi:hypothetical protein
MKNTMRNQAMRRALDAGECLDVLKEGQRIQEGLYRLKRFVEDVDYCDSELEQWIWSIGLEKETGEIYASNGTTFYQNEKFKCLFLR